MGYRRRKKYVFRNHFGYGPKHILEFYHKVKVEYFFLILNHLNFENTPLCFSDVNAKNLSNLNGFSIFLVPNKFIFE